jgi:CubicO group peptidase (beta-lactamase class C family)
MGSVLGRSEATVAEGIELPATVPLTPPPATKPVRHRRPVVDGWLHPDFTEVADALRRQLEGWPGGAAVCVYHEGRCVADLWGGERDAEGRAWTHDTMAPSFSTTKGVASTILHVLVDRGLLHYDDRVAEHWPEFAQAGKQRITVRQVLAHQAGLYHIRQMIEHADRMLDWQHMVGVIERATPIHEPGTATGYHGLTFGFLVGELARRATGKPFPALVREVLAEPLGLDGLYIGAPAAALPRAAKLIWPAAGRDPAGAFLGLRESALGFLVQPSLGLVQRALGFLGFQLDFDSMLDALAPHGIATFDFNGAETLAASIPAANGLFTARSLARLYAVLANGGTLDGVQLLSPETLAEALTVQPAPPGRVVIPFDMRWRLGYHAAFTSRGVPARAFGHFGFGGSGAWADPRRNLAVALTVNSGLGTLFGDLRIVRIGGAALASVARRRR